MHYGINTFLFASPFTNDSTRWFAQFRDWGFDAVEIALEDPADVDPGYVGKQLAGHGLVCHTVCAAMGPARDFRGTPEQQQTAMTYLKALVDVAAGWGSKAVVGPLYSSVGRAGPESAGEYARQWQTVAEHLRTLCHYAAEQHMQIAIEPLNRFETDFINTVDQALRMIETVGHPALRIHLDTFHMNIEEKSLPDAIRRAGPHLMHLHICGNDRGTPGNDHTDWTGIRDALRSIDYGGDLVIESFTTDVKSIAKAAAIWRQIEPSRDDIARNGVQFLKNLMS